MNGLTCARLAGTLPWTEEWTERAWIGRAEGGQQGGLCKQIYTHSHSIKKGHKNISAGSVCVCTCFRGETAEMERERKIERE